MTVVNYLSGGPICSYKSNITSYWNFKRLHLDVFTLKYILNRSYFSANFVVKFHSQNFTTRRTDDIQGRYCNTTKDAI
jgi:hypothetical protein